MFTFSEPTDREIAKYISSQAKLPFSYAEVGATRNNNNAAGPAGYTLDHNRVQLGRGAEVYQRAVEALQQWRQFELGWVTLVPPGVKLEEGAVVAVKARAGGMWSLNACRVVYVIDEGLNARNKFSGDKTDRVAIDDTDRLARDETDRVAGEVRRFGFAYGTLPDHIERGEERFLIERQPDDSVWYDILAFSQPRHPLVRAGFLYARRLQKRFARDSLAVMKSLTYHP
jgi:uncharacterized protein (UPF0548 family)